MADKEEVADVAIAEWTVVRSMLGAIKSLFGLVPAGRRLLRALQMAGYKAVKGRVESIVSLHALNTQIDDMRDALAEIGAAVQQFQNADSPTECHEVFVGTQPLLGALSASSEATFLAKLRTTTPAIAGHGIAVAAKLRHTFREWVRVVDEFRMCNGPNEDCSCVFGLIASSEHALEVLSTEIRRYERSLR